MNCYGLTGFPLIHSFSKKYFEKKFQIERTKDCSYDLFPLENIQDLAKLIEEVKCLKGLNVTIPHKKAVIRLLDEIDEEAELTGAVNCIKIYRKNNKTILKGFNTDVPAFVISLVPFLEEQHTSALVLGTGGASAAVCRGLEVLNIPFIRVSRNPSENDISYEILDRDIIESHKLIINTSPLGMFPADKTFPPVPYQHLTPGHLLYDLVYNPELTLFLEKGSKAGAKIKNGLEMLYLQAELSWNIWQA